MSSAPITLMSRDQVPSRRPYPTGQLLDGKPRAIVFDSNKCIGCRQCVEACKDWNELPRGNQFTINSSTWLTMEPPVLDGTASLWGRNSCMHCEYPACAAVCPVEAITKYAEGPVVIDQDVCIGCKYCVYACPWHVISTNEVTGKSTKCTMCCDRLSDGGKEPFCVKACPVDALAFGIVEDMDAEAAARADTAPSWVYGAEEAGGTHLREVLFQTAREHGRPSVPAVKYPRHMIPFRIKISGIFGLEGGFAGKVRSVTNAITKPWRLRYRYWQSPGRD
jgi:Fe-S-cluster-containing dehydrogenase component